MSQVKRNVSIPSSKKLTSGATLSFTGKILNSLFTYLTLLLLVKLLGPYYFGIYNIVFSIIIFVTNIAVFGLDKTPLKFIPVWKKQDNNYLGKNLASLLQFLTLFSSIIIILVMFLSPIIAKLYNEPKLGFMLIIMSLGALAHVFMMYVRATCQSLFNFTRAILPEDYIRPAGYFFFLVCLFLVNNLGYQTQNEIIVPIVFACNFFLAAIVSMIFLYKSLKEKGIPLNVLRYKGINKDVIKYSSINMSSTVLMQSRTHLAILITGLFVSPELVGYISVAIKTVFFITFVLVAVNSVFSPSISALYEARNLPKLQTLYKSTVKWISIFGTAICTVIFLGSPFIMSVFGEAFIISSLEMKILSLGELINIWTGSVSYILMMTGQQNKNMFVTFLSVLISVGGAFLLVPLLGIMGTAISICLSVVFANLVNLYLVKKTLGVFPYSKNQVGIVIGMFLCLLYGYFYQKYFNEVTIARFLGLCLGICIIYCISILRLSLDRNDHQFIEGYLKKAN